MATQTRVGYIPSVLDRLVDASLGQAGPLWYDEHGLADAVRRDIEQLLNTRQAVEGMQAFPQLRESLLGFGLPDPKLFNWESPASRMLFMRTIEAVIRQHEPRVAHVRVSLVEDNSHRNQLHFRIDAKLQGEQAPDITFDTMLRLGSGHFETREAEALNGN